MPKLGYLISRPFISLVIGNLVAQEIKTSKRKIASLVAPIISSISIIATMALTFGAMGAMDIDNESARQNEAIMSVIIIPCIIFSAISIINTVVMSNSVRKSNIANMRLLGISNSQIKIMVVLESIIIGIIGALVGLVISFISAFVFNVSVKKSIESVPFVYPWDTLGIMIGLYLVVALISSLWTVHRILKNTKLRPT